MKNLRSLPILGFAAGALLLAGCSTGGSTESPAASSSAQPSAAPSGQAQAQQMGFGGVSGEIVYAQDGTLQVQDSQSQTAVRYTADTTVQQQVTVSLADVTVGQCVLAIVGDDGTASTVRVSDPVDGECTAGFGGGGFPGGGQGGPQGDGAAPGNGTAPSGAPTAMPGGGGHPSDMPTAMPSGAPGDGQMPGGQGGFDGTFVTGSVTALSATSLTVQTDDGSSDVAVGTDTAMTGTQAADSSAIAVGMCLTAQGKSDDAGGLDATSITISAKGDDGCSTRGFGGGMGGPNGQRGDGNANGGSNA